MPDNTFNIKDFFRDAVTSLVRPGEYFATMPRGRGIGESILAAVIFGAITGAINFIWSISGTGIFTGPVGRILGGGIGILSFFGSVIGAIIALFIGGVFILLISALCGGSTDFETNLRVSAAILVILPLKALLGFITGTTHHPEAFISLATSLYGLWMLYNALAHALGCREKSARVVSIVLASVPALILITGIMCTRAAESISRDLKTMTPGDAGNLLNKIPGGGKDAREGIERLRKMMEEAQKNPKDQ